MADRISDLPEEILCRILSFLQTEQAVVTSVLSQRWKLVWRSLPTLDFDDANYVQSMDFNFGNDYENYAKQKETYDGFVRFVSAVLLLRDSHQSIQKFRLRCSSFEFYDPIYMCQWIHAAVQSRVEHLHLSLTSGWRRRQSSTSLNWWRDPINPIVSIVNCSTLMVLNLENLVLQPSSSPHFPSLKILHMRDVGISDDSEFSKFISGCLILENLNLDAISLKGENGNFRLCLFRINFSIINCNTLVVLKLRILRIEASSFYHFPSLKVLQMKNLEVDDIEKFLSGCPILENLEKRKIFSRSKFSSVFINGLPIINCSTLVVLKLRFLDMEPHLSPYFPSLKILHMEKLLFYNLVCLSKFLSGCPNLEELKTIGAGIRVCYSQSEGEFEILPKLVRASIREDHVFLLKAVTNAKFLHIYN